MFSSFPMARLQTFPLTLGGRPCHHRSLTRLVPRLKKHTQQRAVNGVIKCAFYIGFIYTRRYSYLLELPTGNKHYAAYITRSSFSTRDNVFIIIIPAGCDNEVRLSHMLSQLGRISLFQTTMALAMLSSCLNLSFICFFFFCASFSSVNNSHITSH